MVRGDMEADAGGGDSDHVGVGSPVPARQPGLGVLRLPWETQSRMAGLRAHRFPLSSALAPRWWTQEGEILLGSGEEAGGVGVKELHWVTCRKLPFRKLISTWLFMITVAITMTYMRNTFGKSVLCSSLLWQSSSFPSFLFQEASSTCFPPSPSLLPFPPFLRPSLLRIIESQDTGGEGKSNQDFVKPGTFASQANCIQRQEVTAVAVQLAGDRSELNTQHSWGHLMFSLLFWTAASSCLPFFSLPACLPPLSDSKNERWVGSWELPEQEKLCVCSVKSL